jgi:hypothetical protein
LGDLEPGGRQSGLRGRGEEQHGPPVELPHRHAERVAVEVAALVPLAQRLLQPPLVGGRPVEVGGHFALTAAMAALARVKLTLNCPITLP